MIWRDIDIEWKGEQYTIRPTIEFINRIEQRDGHSIQRVFSRMVQGDAPLGVCAEIIADTLNFAGATVTPDDVFAEMQSGVVRNAQAIIVACFPPQNEEAPKKKARAKAAK